MVAARCFHIATMPRVGGPFESANGLLPLRIDDDHFTPIEH